MNGNWEPPYKVLVTSTKLIIPVCFYECKILKKSSPFFKVLNWLEEIEELMMNQKPPSSDYKVVRAQIQNHELQRKLVYDKQQNIEGFHALTRHMELANDSQKEYIRSSANEIKTR